MIRRLIWIGFVIAGVLLIGLSVSQTHAQGGDDEAEYVGARECSACHREIGRAHEESPHALALISERDDEFFVADFEVGEEVRTVTFDESESRPFEQDDIAYALGAGRYVQRYILEVDRGEYVIFPAQWSSVEEAWQPYGPVENWPDDPAYDFGFSCARCHTTGLNVRRVRWEDDGVQCEACHGPGSSHVDEAEEAGNDPSDRDLRNIREAIALSPDPYVCGQCHITGTEPEDNHPFPVEYQIGGDLLDEDVFEMVPPDDDAHWWATGHAKSTNMQFNEWILSAHSMSLDDLRESESAGDGCLACHSGDYNFIQDMIAATEEGERPGDPPDPITLEDAQYGVVCTTCHNPHSDPAETNFFLEDDTYTLCVSCHTDNDLDDYIHHPVRQMFEGMPVVDEVAAAPSAHFSSEDGPKCTTCHMPRVPVEGFSLASHSLQPVLPGAAIDIEELEDTCSRCHGENLEAMGIQAFIDTLQDNIQTRLDASREALTGDEPEWVVKTLDFVAGDGSRGMHNPDYANTLLNAVEVELGLNEVPGPRVTDGQMPTGESIETEEPTLNVATEAADQDIATVAYVIMALAALLVIGAGWVFFFRQEATDEI